MPEAMQEPTVQPKAVFDISGVDIHELVKAIRAKKGNDAIPLFSLQELGFKKHREAYDNVYVRLLLPKRKAGHSCPEELWLAPGHQQAVSALAAAFRSASGRTGRNAKGKKSTWDQQFEQLLTRHGLEPDAFERAVLYWRLVGDATDDPAPASLKRIRSLLAEAMPNKPIWMACMAAPDRVRPHMYDYSAALVLIPFTISLHGKEYSWPVQVRVAVEGPGWRSLRKDLASGALSPEKLPDRLTDLAAQAAAPWRSWIEKMVHTANPVGQDVHTDWYADDARIVQALRSEMDIHWLPGTPLREGIRVRMTLLVQEAIWAEVRSLGYQDDPFTLKTTLPIRVPGSRSDETVSMPVILSKTNLLVALQQVPRAQVRDWLERKFHDWASQQEKALHLAFEEGLRAWPTPVDDGTGRDVPDPRAIQSALLRDFMRKFAIDGRDVGRLVQGDQLAYRIRMALDDAVEGPIRTYEHQRLSALSTARLDYIQQFPLARELGRKLVAYLGPTNSGKTWQALNRLAEAHTGVYLGPLRLLALEGQEELEKRGCTVSLLTGEERELKDGATHVASTVEMADLQTPVDCVVIDEIQMLGDPERGAGWLQALVGMPVREVILTGSANAQYVLEQISQILGEPLEVHHLSRQTLLHVMDQPVALDKVEPGTAIIVFSRADVLRLQAQLPPGVTSAVIYGSLGPAVRRAESERFRSGDAQVLIATDAIAYGLNLPIKTVLFSTAHKYIDRELIGLDPALIQQIAGRAGRFGLHEAGFVGALDKATLDKIKFGMRARPTLLRLPLLVRPGYASLRAIQRVVPEVNSVTRLLQFYKEYVKFDAKVFRNQPLDSMLALADIADSYPDLSLRDRFTLACAPVDAGNYSLMERFEEYVSRLGQNIAVIAQPPGDWMGPVTDDSETLFQAENLLKEYDLYAWLAFHFPVTFTGISDVQKWRAQVNQFISASLAKGVIRRCRTCREPLPPSHVYPNCESCFRATRRSYYGDYDYDEEDDDSDYEDDEEDFLEDED